MSRWGVFRGGAGMAGCLSCLVAVGASQAQEAAGWPEAEETQRVLDAIHAELELVREENSQMREEMDILRAQNDDDWLTEHRAEEIKGLVADVLADADTRASLSGNGLMAGWSDDFFLASADGRFLLKIGALLQNRYIYNHRKFEKDAFFRNGFPRVDRGDKDVYGFEVTTARLNFSGHVFKDIDYKFEIGYGRLDPYAFGASPNTFGARLYEAWVRHRLTDNWSIKSGLFKAPYSREFLIYAGRQLLVERSSLSMRIATTRVMGAELGYVDDEIRFQYSFNSGSGNLFTGLGRTETVPPWSFDNDQGEWAMQSRMEFLLAGEWSQFNQFTSPPGQEFGLMAGIAGEAQKAESIGEGGGSNDLAKSYGATADVSVMFGGASLFASFYWEKLLDVAPSLPNSNFLGATVQGSFYMDQKTEFFARYQWGGPYDIRRRPGVNNPFGEKYQIVQLGLNYYIDGQNVKFTIDGGIAFNEMNGVSAMNQTGWLDGPDTEHNAQWLIRAQLQLMF